MATYSLSPSSAISPISGTPSSSAKADRSTWPSESPVLGLTMRTLATSYRVT